MISSRRALGARMLIIEPEYRERSRALYLGGEPFIDKPYGR